MAFVKFWRKDGKRANLEIGNVFSKLFDAANFMVLDEEEKLAVIEMQKAVYFYMMELEEELDNKFLREISKEDGIIMRPLALEEKDRQLYREYLDSKSGVNLPLGRIIADRLPEELQLCLSSCMEKVACGLAAIIPGLVADGKSATEGFIVKLDKVMSNVEDEIIRKYKAVLALEAEIKNASSGNREKSKLLIENYLREKDKQLQLLVDLGKELLEYYCVVVSVKERVAKVDNKNVRK